MHRARRGERHRLDVVRALLKVETATPGPGQCLLHNIDGRLFVDRADPQILISEDLLIQVYRGLSHPDLHLDRGGPAGTVLEINGSNQRVTYRIGPSDGAGHRLASLT